MYWGRLPHSPWFPLQPHDLRAQVSTPGPHVAFLLYLCFVEFFCTLIRPLGSLLATGQFRVGGV